MTLIRKDISDLSWEERILLQEKYKGVPCPAFFRDQQRLKEGVPLPYLLKNQQFLYANIDLSYRPFIPRPETEWWVEKSLPRLTRYFDKKCTRILDIFAGSGCIGINALLFFRHARVDFGEKYLRAQKQIIKNIKNLPPKIQKRARLVPTDAFSHVKGKYHIIFANPPYVDKKKNLHQKNIEKYEPVRAIFAKDSGLFYIKQILTYLPAVLHVNGVVLIEIDDWQKPPITHFVNSLPHSLLIKFLPDQYKKTRLLFATQNTRLSSLFQEW